MPPPKPGGRRRSLEMCAVGNAVFSVVDGGITGRVTATSVSDPAGVRLRFARLGGAWKKLRLLWVDRTYRGQLVAWVSHHRRFGLQITLCPEGAKGFVLCLAGGWSKFYTDGWGAYERHLDAETYHVGKANTQKIESKHSNLRTRIKRLVRRTICFSKTERIHDLVIGLFINRYEFGRLI